MVQSYSLVSIKSNAPRMSEGAVLPEEIDDRVGDLGILRRYFSKMDSRVDSSPLLALVELLKAAEDAVLSELPGLGGTMGPASEECAVFFDFAIGVPETYAVLSSEEDVTGSE